MSKFVMMTLSAVALIIGTAHVSLAAQYVTIAGTAINVEKIELIQPIFCNGSETSGTCGFTVVFNAADYSTTVSKSGNYGATHSARDKFEVLVMFGNAGLPDVNRTPEIAENAFSTKADALKVLKGLRDLLPK